MKHLTPVLAAAFLVLPASSFAIDKCVTQSGDTIFTDHGCPSGTTPAGTMNYDYAAPSGLRPGERRMLDSIEAREDREREEKRYARERDARNYVGYSDRKEIKRLEMRKRQLSDSLSRGSKSYGQASAIRSEIRGIDRQIEQIRSPSW